MLSDVDVFEVRPKAMRLLGSKVAVAFDSPDEKSHGFYIPDELRDHLRTQIGTVIAAGPEMVFAEGEYWPFPPIGSTVIVMQGDGTRIQDTGYAYEVRVYGMFAVFQGEPQMCPWWESVLAMKEREEWTAFGNNVIIECDPDQNKIGAIWLPETAQKGNSMATVVSAGPLARGLKKGDRVCYAPRSLDDGRDPSLGERGFIVKWSAIEYVEDAA